MIVYKCRLTQSDFCNVNTDDSLRFVETFSLPSVLSLDKNVV